ncbi:kinase-like domain-containing protein [Penicillium sp. DV-2018c]|nr:kinase-like domain-containing protein [Penicillium sp. DV-2018c]KAJ5563227.1 kinase-like domain-containing protein [Penicillium sp. DV-2018c]
MATMFRLSRQLLKRPLFRRATSPARKFSQSNFLLLDSAEKFEEETLPWYSPDRFYPIKIGEIFQSRYQVIGKLGFGGYSTAWLCRDLQQHVYVTLKMFERDSAEGIRETEVYDHLNALSTCHNGALLVRTALDSFQIGSPEGNYQCLIHPPLGISLFEFRNQLAAKVLPEKITKLTLLHVLLALDFLHTEAGVVHTEGEKSNPSPRKVDGDRVIYFSRKLGRTRQHGRSILCDFGQARFGSSTYCGDIQPHIYRAPEVLLRMPWDQKVDIWNMGVMAWDLFQKGHLFYARDSDKQDSDSHHLAEMIALLGPPPKDMLRMNDYATEFFDSEGMFVRTVQLFLMLIRGHLGNWKERVQIPLLSLEDLEWNLQGSQQQLFLGFMRKMLRWRPEERESAKDLLSDPWLRSP